VNVKINVGCGLVYKGGYVNIDAHDDTVADARMEAHWLDFENESAEHIECSHVLEHMGLGEAVYALSEFYRVLRPSGTLLLRTPDVEESFRTFVKSGQDKRKLLLNWIYGLDRAGMGHKYGYPLDLIEILLHDAGFSNIQAKRVGRNSHRPELSLVCSREATSPDRQFMAGLRHALVKQGVVDVHDQVTAIDIEDVLRTIRQHIIGIVQGDAKAAPSALVDLALHSPRLASIFLTQLLENSLISDEMYQQVSGVLVELEKANIPEVLVNMVRKMPLEPLTQSQAYESVCRLGLEAVRRAVSGRHMSTETEWLSRPSSVPSTTEGVTLFTEQALRSLSSIHRARGMKAFAQGDLDLASAQLLTALKLDRDSLSAAWNLARVMLSAGESDMSLRYIDYSVVLANAHHPAEAGRFLKGLEADRRQVVMGTQGPPPRPLYDVD